MTGEASQAVQDSKAKQKENKEQTKDENMEEGRGMVEVDQQVEEKEGKV